MRKFVWLLSACILGTTMLTAGCCDDWCDNCWCGWPEANKGCCDSDWPSPFNIFLGGGYRQDNFMWSIAGPNKVPNVLSKLEWKKLRIAQFGGTASYVSCRNYAIRIDASYGQIYNGRNKDTDYLSNGKKDIFSLSKSNAGKGHVYDLSGAVGYRVTSTCSRFIGTALVGYAHYGQYLHIYDGKQIIDIFNECPGPIPNLNSTYTTRWFGPWIGIDFMAKVERCTYLFGSIQGHLLEYRGRGRWNLREDIGPFFHKAYGYGYLATLGTSWEIWDNWAIGVVGSYRNFKTHSGHDRTKINDPICGPTHIRLRFNHAKWRSFSISGVIVWRF